MMVLPKFSLTGKVAIVTGAGRGIGKAIALSFAEAGADIMVAARTVTEIEATAQEIRELGKEAYTVQTDVTNAEQVANMVQKTLDQFGKIDILANNAGTTPSLTTHLTDTTTKDCNDIISSNLTSVILCCTAVGKVMMEQKSGSIINISSLASLAPRPGYAAYAGVKAAINHLTQSLAAELGPYNIRVNAILPGRIETPLTIQLYDGQTEMLQNRLKKIPMGRVGKPDDIAGTAIYLASEAASFVSGALIVVSGGQVT